MKSPKKPLLQLGAILQSSLGLSTVTAVFPEAFWTYKSRLSDKSGWIYVDKTLSQLVKFNRELDPDESPKVQKREQIKIVQEDLVKKTRLKKALAALKAQMSAIPEPEKSVSGNKALQAAQAKMMACQPETTEIVRFLLKDKTQRKTIREITISDLLPLYTQ